VVSAEVVERLVFDSYAALARTARITAHLPALTEHFAAERVAVLAAATGLRPSEAGAADDSLDEVRRIRDAVDVRVLRLLADLVPAQ
jgi:hypothetical protein